MAPPGAFDLDSYLGLGAIKLQPGSSSDVKRQLAPLRLAMSEVFDCSTAFGDCHPEHPSSGHCMLSAMVVQDLYGGCIRGGTVSKIPHYWNDIGGVQVDLTADQFGDTPIRVSKGTLYPGSFTFRREPQEELPQPYNKKVSSLHRRFRKKLIPVLKEQGMSKESTRLSKRNR
jgi:hypothetical protein